MSCFLFGCVASALADSAIVPGQRIGKVRLDDSQQHVRQLLGKPGKTMRRRDGLRVDQWSRHGMIEGNPLILFMKVIYRAKKVIQIETNDNDFATPEGISTNIGNNPRDLKKQFKGLNWRIYLYTDSPGYHSYYYDNVRRGCALRYPHFQAKDSPEVFSPFAIIVHHAGRRTIPEAGARLIKSSNASIHAAQSLK